MSDVEPPDLTAEIGRTRKDKFSERTGSDGAFSDLGIDGAIRELRREMGLSQIELASEIGQAPLTVSRLETGVILPTRKALDAMLTILGASPEEEVKILFNGGYAPTQEEVDKYNSLFEQALQDCSRKNMACVVIDTMGWRMLSWNDQAEALLHLNQAKEVIKSKQATPRPSRSAVDELSDYPQLLEMLFDPAFALHQAIFGADQEQAAQFLREKLAEFDWRTKKWSKAKLGWLHRIQINIAKSAFVKGTMRGTDQRQLLRASGAPGFTVSTPEGPKRLVELSSTRPSFPDPRFGLRFYLHLEK